MNYFQNYVYNDIASNIEETKYNELILVASTIKNSFLVLIRYENYFWFFLTSLNVLIADLLTRIGVFIISWEIDFYGDMVNDSLY